MIFLNGLFGYLCFLIIYKWIVGSTADLYTVLIDMFLKPGSIDEDGDLFGGQSTVQVILVLAAFFSVPWMLLPKPFILRARHNRRKLVSQQIIVLSSASHVLLPFSTLHLNSRLAIDIKEFLTMILMVVRNAGMRRS